MRGAKHIALTTAVLLTANTGLWAQSHIPWVSSWQEAQHPGPTPSATGPDPFLESELPSLFEAGAIRV